jgi:hypothetical protein
MGAHFDRAVFLGTALHQAANIILNIRFCLKKNQEHSPILIQLGQKILIWRLMNMNAVFLKC